MMRDKRSKWLSGVGVVVLIGGLALANYGGGVTPAQAHDRHYHNPFKQILSKLNLILDKLNSGASSSSSGGVAGNYTMRWDTIHPSDSRFTTAFPGAVLDKNTGLVWEQLPKGTSGNMWSDARLECINKSVGGQKGWRLPSVVELASLINPSLLEPVVPGVVFTGVQVGNYWSGTTSAGGSTTAFVVSSDDRSVGTSNKTSTNLYVWCVRGPMNESAY
ncbi:MAG: DUF1566 domain-containing protein [Nitrospiraceae bacterium]